MSKRSSIIAGLDLFTIGAIGWTADEFFRALDETGIHIFVDIRDRRGVRGAEYAWANAARLQAVLEEHDIAYLHLRELAPSQELRDIQAAVDKASGIPVRKRLQLSDEFRTAYHDRILAEADLDDVVHEIRDMRPDLPDPVRACFFCVEHAPAACHRSLLTAALAERFDLPLTHL